ncbi:helix-turn-helix domain-containing protein [Nonomuraea sp. NPDC050643]|uniref:helix-turn-helix domain-containing protein n=1 Tax=Nonomuraea sp. NPDC050643 TaxID=3155660 RepID=UPI003407FC97
MSTESPILVIAMERATGSRTANGIEATAHAIERHLSGYTERVVTVCGEVVYSDLRLADSSDTEVAAAVLRVSEFVRSWREHGVWCAGIGGPVAGDHSVPTARVAADRTLRLLKTDPSAPRAALFSDVSFQVALSELKDLVTAEGQESTGSVAQLAAHDREHGTRLLETLRQWLAAFGNSAAAARKMSVPVSTFRSRLRRVVAISHINLDDTSARLDAELQMRLFHPPRADGS